MAGSYPFGGSTPAVGKFLTVTATGELSWDTVAGAPGTGVTSVAPVGSSPAAEGASISGNVLTLQPADGTFPGVMTAIAQTIGGAKTFTGAITASNLSGTNTGNVTLAAVGAVPNANGATLTGQVLNLQAADGTNPGALTATTQTIGGDKTFIGKLTIDKTAQVGVAESLATFKVTDDATGQFDIYNNTIANNLFAPAFKGTAGNSATLPGLDFIGAVAAANDSGTAAVTVFQAWRTSLAPLTTRPTFAWYNYNTKQMEMSAAGKLTVGGATGAVLDLVSSSVSGGLLTVQTTSASGYAEITFKNNSGTAVGTLGYGNASVAAPFTSTVYLQTVGKDFKIVSGAAGATLQFTLTSATGAATFVGALAASNLSGTNTGNVSLAAVGAAPNANGATLAGQVLNLEPASATQPGVVTTGAQTLAGAKTFNGAVGMVVPPVLTTGAAGIAGTATLVGGTVTVATTAVATGDRIMVSRNAFGGTPGHLEAPTASIVNATSFVINSSDGADTSTVNWILTR